MTNASRNELRQYAEAIRMWLARFDTQSIADRLHVPEHTVARWVANFRDIARAA